ncbi:unnamed protein product [Cylicostephanus goldi]|uniref:Uncharacterized protein n=1 Tax=Cylicostephanus goldi TaxID=71465 RepID=A0A3P6RLF8_CYLGO|nr:unnamed protein product [Cylicostephanus goldi]
MCSDRLYTGDEVRWKESVVEAYWNFLITFQFPKHDNPPSLTCPDCNNTELTGFGMNGSEYFVRSLHMKHHMLLARGQVTSVDDWFCDVNWGNCNTLVPKAMLRLAEDQ